FPVGLKAVQLGFQMAGIFQVMTVLRLQAVFLQNGPAAVEGGFGDAHRHGSDHRAGVVEGLHYAGEPLFGVNVGAAEQVGGRDAAIGKGNGSGVGGFDTEFLFQPHHVHAGGAFFHHKGLDGGAADTAVEAGPDHHCLGALTGGDVNFFAVQNVMVAVFNGGGADGGGIG